MRHTKLIIFTLSIVTTLLIGLSSLLPSSIYSSAVWHIFWIVIAAVLVFGIIMGRLWRNWPAFIMHISFLCMIAGGFCTSLFSRQGTLHLLPEQTANHFIVPDGKLEKLPTAITLLSFAPEYYPGMNFPKDFKSVLKTASGDTIRIAMNHIGHLDHYRFYQTSYDEQGGTVLTVTYDPLGIAVTYTGFALFAFGGMAWLLKTIRKSKVKRKAIAACILALCASGNAEEAYAVRAVDPHMADSLAVRQVLFNGQPTSFSAFSTKLTYKLTGRGSVGQLSPEAFVASLIKYKEDWSKVAFLKIKSDALRKALAIEGKYAALANFYDENGNYIPENLYEGGSGPLDKDILSLDEKVALIIDLWDGELFTPLPADSPKLRSNLSIKSEILYYKINPVKILFICALLSIALIIFSHFFRKNIRIFPIITGLGIAGVIAWSWLWYISGSVPLSNTADIMEFVGICMILLSGVAAWRNESPLLVVLGLSSAAFLLLVALLGLKDPVMSPVMPVLASPWLSIHVSLVMLAYAILGFTLPVAISALIVPRQRERLTSLAISLLTPSSFLIGLGIITRDIWANVSWGRYWAWDPKETWSLVTLILYSIPLHKYFKMQKLPIVCSLYLIFAFFAIIMTYFGVNLLPSLHAYN